MPQILKEETREAILRSALTLFARCGYRDTSLQEVARGAELSVGNLYRYFPDKKALYEAAVPPQLLSELTDSLDRKFAAWRGFPLTAGEELIRAEMLFREELVSILAVNRLYWVILLRDGLEDVLVDRLTAFFVRWAGQGEQKLPLDGERTATLTIMYRNLTRLLGSVLTEKEDPDALKRGLSECLEYHMGGLAALTETWRKQ